MRLDKVTLWYEPTSPNTRIREYDLSYETSPSTNRSRLISVQECAGEPLQCYSPTNFTYLDGTAGFSAEIQSGSTVPAGSRALSADINGDGRTDIIYASSSGNWHYRLASATGGFGPVQDSTISSANDVQAITIDYNQDGIEDILVPNQSSNWSAILGSTSGLQSPIDTGAPVESLAGNAMAADIDGDGREDLVWAINVGTDAFYPDYPQIFVRYREQGPGFSDPADKIFDGSNGEQIVGPTAFENNFRQSRLMNYDIDGNGYKDVAALIYHRVPFNPNFYYMMFLRGGGVGQKNVNHENQYDPTIGIPIDMNGDGYTDMAYDDGSGSLRYQISTGKDFLAEATGPDISALDFSKALPRDWDSDGYEDILLPNASTGAWLYIRSTGKGFEPASDAGFSEANVREVHLADTDGNGLEDINFVESNGDFSTRPHAGQMPDLLESATDGFGNMTKFTYEPVTDDLYERYADAAFPQQDYIGSLYVVSSQEESTGVGSNTFTRTFTYAGAQLNLEGRGLSGFDKKTTIDNRNGISVTRFFRRDFPYRGRKYREEIRQPDGTLIQEVSYNWAAISGGSGNQTYHFPYIQQSTERNFEVGGTYNGSQINEISTTRQVDSYGTVWQSTVVTEEKTTANGLQPGASYTEQVTHSSISNNETSWCLGLPGRTEWSNSHTGTYGTQIIRTVTRQWDTGALCRQLQETVEPGSPDYQVSTSIGYDAFGNVDSQTVTGTGMSPRTTTINWGAVGQFPETITNPLGQSSTKSWDYSLGVQESEMDPNGATVSWLHDEFGKRTRETRPDGTYTEISRLECALANSYCGTSYDRAVTRVRASQRRTDGTEIRFDDTFLDKADRTVQVEWLTMSGSISRVRTIYDSLGRVDKRSAPSFSVNPQYYTETAYDLLNRPTQIWRPIDATNPALQLTTVDYQGLTVVTTDAEGKKSTKVMDALDRVFRSIDHNGYFQQTDYDAFGSIRRVQDPQDDLFQATYGYGAKAFRDTSYDMDLGSWSYTPNALGEVEAYTDAKGQNFSATFDKLSRPLTRTEPDESTTWTWGTSAASNNIGRLESIVTGAHQIEYFYDSAGRVIQRKTTADAVYLTDYGYDAVSGQLKSLTYPESTSGYRLKLEYFYQNGVLTKVADFDPPYTVAWEANSVDARGNVIDSTLGNGIKVIRGFDAVTGRPDYFQAGPGGGSWTQDLTFDWNKVGSLTERADLNRGLTEAFFYDNLHRLDYSELNNVQNLDIGYDALGRGNITYKSDVGPGTWTYHATKEHAVTAAGGNTYSYDANGNQISRNGNTVDWTSYNYPSRVENGAESHEFFYDGDRQRWKQVYNGPSGQDVTIFVGKLLEKRTVVGVTEYRHYIRAGNTPIALYSRDTTGEVTIRYLLQDQLGSMSEITRSDSNPYVSESFSAFGKRRDAVDWSGPPSPGDKDLIADATQRGFTFHTNLEENNLVHMNGRVADAAIGRFLSPDPFVPEAGSTQSFNRYSYVRNNPLSATDPSGFFEFACFDNVTCTFSVIGSALSFLGDLFGGSSAPPPKGCFVAGKACYGTSQTSRLERILDDLLGLPHDRFDDRYGGIIMNIQDSAIGGDITGARRTVLQQATGERTNDSTIFVGGGFSVTFSIFGKDVGFEGSIAAAVTLGPNTVDAGLILQRGTPTDDLPIAANIGGDVTFGAINRSLEAMEGTGEATNLVVPVFVAPFSVSGSEFRSDSGEVIGGQVGVGTPGVGASVTETNTSTLSLRRSARRVRYGVSDLFCNLDPACL